VRCLLRHDPRPGRTTNDRALAQRRGALKLIFLIGVSFGLILGYGLLQLIQAKKDRQFFAITEYWVYLPKEELPPQDEVMKLLLGGNSPIGPEEGLLLSDIRLHVGLVLRSKNLHVFRPDLLDESVVATAEQLSLISECQAVAKLRFLSEFKLKSEAHLKLMPYLAYAYAKLADGKVVYDSTAELLMTVPELLDRLKNDREAKGAETHLRTVWKTTANGGKAETHGLVKKGLPELITLEVHSDERLLVTGLMEDAARQLWNSGVLSSPIEVDSFNDRFQLILSPVNKGLAEVRILRIQAQ